MKAELEQKLLQIQELPTFRTPFCVVEIFSSRPTLWIIYLQNKVIDHIEYSISLGCGVVREPHSSIDMALLVEGALLKEHPLIAKI
jgi:hypothetical protein